MDASKRYAFFDLINEAGFMYDNPTLREEVLRDVTDREMSLVRLLVEAGVCLDVGPLNALKMAVTQMDLEILDVLSHGTFDNVSAALDWVPPNATEQGILKVLEKLRALCLEGDPLSRRLICAVRSKHVLEATELIRMGASIDYKQGLALQIAIRSSDPDMLDILLHGDCTPQVLSRVVPALMKVQPPKARLSLLERILIKGTLPETLGGPLEVLLAESGEADLECIALLLRYGASPDASDEEATNSVLVAASRGWLHALKLLCEAPIRPMILAKAVLVGFRDFPTAAQDHDTLLTIMRLLLGKGAKGKLVDQTLLSAVTRESRLDVVQLLLSSGANANYKQGEAFVSALGSRNSRIFDALCKTCPPDLASSERIMPYAIGQRYYEPKSLNTFLQCTQHKRAALDVISAASLEKSSNIKTIMHCLLSHGLRVNGGECKFLHLAVLADDISLLQSMLAAKPNVLSLQLAFETALRVNKRRKRLDVMKFLLEHASATEIGQTMCIAHQTQLAIDGDLEGLRLILHHGASVDHQGGIAVQRAARSGLMDVLRLLLKYRPGVDTVTKACLACLESFEKRGDISPDHKNSIYEALLDSSAGINVDHLSSLLLASIQSVSSEVQFPMLLLRRGAKVYEKTTRLALETASDDLSRLIVRKSSGRELFHLVFACELTVERRTWLLDEWLKQDIRQVDKCRALLHSLDTKRIHDLPIVELLLKHGADVSFENGEALKLAVRAQSPDAIALLGKSVKTREVANNAFAYAAKAVFNDPSTRFKIYQGLLNGNLVDKANCYGALKNCLDRQGADLDTVRLLVTKGADPCAACFISTCRIGSTKHFRELCKSADLDRLVDALLSSFHDETDAARWLKLCLQQQHPSARITNPDLLIRCIKKYPNGEVLTGLVLARSNIAAQTVIYSVFPGWAEEKCSLLIWALLSRPRVSSKTILKLLAAGCDVDLETPTTRVSASMACVLDNSRTPVLKALLKMRPDLALEPHVPASVLACLGAEPGSASKDPINEIGALTLCQASVYVGNIDSYELLASYSVPDEDDLHLAAWLALPKFVEKFLKDHDPELESEAYGNYTPLAVALETDSGQSYCKVADAEASFEDRRKRTIDLLAKKSNLAWRYRQKTYVHIAFAIGPGTTKILLDALDIKTASSRFSMLVYEDKAGRRYTPFEYINELMNLQPSERDELMRCLAGANLLTDAERITFAYR
ncbi:hypothetical protein CKM354_000872700 [Cercospora kikuchii]|uniref:Ankyrin repeat protein n=1 Tax=Cercospora kikuchii TaxID=84275 RepID=A0A9P3CLT7_9PEZI|nr:uncharacterized protein CKM354_000872700 [Cercospora kikuchii]GIZ45567.1 hypothetical protein CKM354_000872700 [Cercospora kikuchii]